MCNAWCRTVAFLCFAGLAGLLVRPDALAQDAGADPGVVIGDTTTIDLIGDPATAYGRGRDLVAGYIGMAGGVMGSKPVRIVAQDSGGTADGATRAIASLREQGAVLFMGGLVADATLAAARAAAPAPFVAVDARLPSAMVANEPNLFQIGPSAEALGRALAAEAARTGATRWGVVAQDDYFGRALAHAFWSALRAERPDIELALESYVPTLSGSVASAVEQVAAARPEGLLLGLRDVDLVAFARAARGNALDGAVVMAPHVGTPEILGALGAEITEGWVTTGAPCCEVGGQPHRAFAEAYRAADPDGATPTASALYGYVAMTALATALDEAWSVKPDRLTAALTGLSLSTPIGPMRFDPDTRQSSLPFWVGRISGGRFVDARPVDPAVLHGQ